LSYFAQSRLRSHKWPILLVTAAVFLAGAAQADQLVMKNGDRITGSIVKKDGKTITIKSETFGVITAPWEQVESIKADKPLTVVLEGGKTVQGTLAGAAGTVEVSTKDGPVTVKPAEVEVLRDAAEQKAYERLLNPGWGQLWTGTGSVGLAGTNGNAKTLTFTTGFTAARATRTDKTSLNFSAVKASALANGKNADTAEAVRGGVGYDHNVGGKFFVSGFNSYEYDKFQDLDLRLVVGGGFGFHAVKNDRSQLDVAGGVAYDREHFGSGLARRSAEAYWGDDYNFRLSQAVSLVQSYRMFNNLSNTGEFRVNFDLGLTTKLTKWLTWNAALSDRYLSNPVGGRKTNDWLYTTGVGFTFSR
jgi:putative salt-induced outer membrane protein YdiY